MTRMCHPGCGCLTVSATVSLMTNNGTTARPVTFDIFVNASGSRAHLVNSDGGGFICGTPAGRSVWACQAVNIPRVLDTFTCAGCVAEMHRLNG